MRNDTLYGLDGEFPLSKPKIPVIQRKGGCFWPHTIAIINSNLNSISPMHFKLKSDTRMLPNQFQTKHWATIFNKISSIIYAHTNCSIAICLKILWDLNNLSNFVFKKGIFLLCDRKNLSRVSLFILNFTCFAIRREQSLNI